MTEHVLTQDQQKQLAAQTAVQYIQDGDVVGLGTGSTAAHFVRALSDRVQEEGLHLMCTTTSNRTTALAQSLGLPVYPLEQVATIDVTVDGADQVDPALNGIKGGGAALLHEKVVAHNSKRNIWITDESKYQPKLNGYSLPVEVIQFGSEHLCKELAAEGLEPHFRLTENETKLVTDSGNYIIDIKIPAEASLTELAAALEMKVGVVEQGLFLNICDQVIIGHADGTVKTLTR